MRSKLMSVLICFLLLLAVQGGCSLPVGCKVFYDSRGDATSVDCSGLQLTAVPRDIPASVTTLLLHQNNISHIPNKTFLALSHLQRLDLSINQTTKLEVKVFEGLQSLKTLDLSRNSIYLSNSSYPNEVFVDLKQLTVLNIQNNTRDGSGSMNPGYPDVALRHLVSLNVLHMDGIQGLTFNGGFRALTNLEVMDFSGFAGFCNLNNISKDLFVNLQTQQPLTLNLSQCNIRAIHPQTFTSLQTLRVLDFQDNGQFLFENFMQASQGFPLSLEVVNITTISRGHYITLHEDYFQYLKKTKIKQISIGRNWVYCIDPKAISNLPRTLTHLSVRDNRLMDADFLIQVVFMPKLEFLDIGKQLVYSAEHTNQTWFHMARRTSKEFCDVYQSPPSTRRSENIPQSGSSVVNEAVIFPKEDIESTVTAGNLLGEYVVEGSVTEGVTHTSDLILDVSSSTCDSVISLSKFPFTVIPLPPFLHTLNGDFIKLGYAIPNVTFNRYNTLRTLNMSSDLLYCLGGPVYGLRELEVFDLSSNQCNAVNPLFFLDMPNLTHLYLQNNNIGPSCAADSQGQMFSSQRKMRVLHLDKNRIQTLPETMFRNLVNLEYLNLAQNSLASLGARIGHIKKLAFLDLSQNEFAQIGKDLRHDLDRISQSINLTVDITGNLPLQCSCDTFDFLQWLLETRVTFTNFENITCLTKDSKIVSFHDLQDFVPTLWLQCNTTSLFTVVLIIFACLLLLLTVSGTLYYKRWRLRYLYYICRRRVNPYHTLGDRLPTDQTLDVFVSYDEEDLDQRRFVQDELMGRLESEQISCLVSEVHFLCGRNTREIIVEAVLGTGKTLALLTNDFFKSRDRELEFNMAVLHGMETHQELVIPVAMETLIPENIPREVREFLQAFPCIPYRDGDPLFWQELVSRIQTTT